MFEKDNLVRLITEDGDSEVMCVIEDSDGNAGITHVMDNDDGDSYISTGDLELVTDNQTKLDSIPQRANTNSVEDFELHDQFNKYIVSVIKALRDRGCDEKIDITIRCEHYDGESAKIEYGVGIRYDSDIYSDNLGKSGHIALSRYEEKKALEVKAIPFYVDDVA
jgi:hypothetical protein